MIDSITNLHTSMEQARQQTEVSTAVLARSIETTEQAGENVENLLQSATPVASAAITDPLMGQEVDISV